MSCILSGNSSKFLSFFSFLIVSLPSITQSINCLFVCLGFFTLVCCAVVQFCLALFLSFGSVQKLYKPREMNQLLLSSFLCQALCQALLMHFFLIFTSFLYGRLLIIHILHRRILRIDPFVSDFCTLNYKGSQGQSFSRHTPRPD